MQWWQTWHERRAWLRWPTKLLLLVAGVWLVLYPEPWMLLQTLERFRTLPTLMAPDFDGLAPLEADVRKLLRAEPDLDPEEAVELVVYDHLPYAWDWDNWGVMEYLPTVEEALAAGREDCDGRAIVAASLLKRMGHDARLVSDFLHMWVEVDDTETMSPGTGAKTVRTTDDRVEVQLNRDTVVNIYRGFAFGITHFPLTRELLILACVILLTLHPQIGFWRFAAAVLLLWIALDLLREVGADAAELGAARARILEAVGFTLALLGWCILAVKRRRPAA